MKRNTRVLIPSALLLLTVAVVSLIGHRIIARQNTKGNLDQITTQDAFVRSLTSARLPGGMVTTSECNPNAKPQKDSLSSPLFESLNRITQTDPQYKWQNERGVINLIPTSGEPDVLKIPIREFRVKNARSLELILEQLLALPEVQSDAVGRRVNQGIRFAGLSSPRREPQLSISIRDATLRDALNAMVRTHGRAVWSYSESRCNGQDRFTIDFLVQ